MEKILEKWQEAKDKIKILEDKIENYKREVKSEMEAKNKNVLSAGDYTVTKRDMTRTSLSKQDVPVEIWQRYSSRSSYPAYFLTKKK